MTSSVTIEPYAASHREQVLEVLARAYSTNPATIALFENGNRPLDQTRELFALRLNGLPGTKRVAICNDEVVGFAHWTRHPPYTGPVPGSVLERLPEDVASRLAIFMSGLHSHDLPEPHCHLGPVAIDPRFQGRGTARQLLRYFCAAPGAGNTTSFLETDLAANVNLFSTFAFEVIRDVEILGVRNWFMVRLPLETPPA